uniref:Eva-1 homolog B n=1 Tax=Catharus ustulatus TaxID=91951 RepID=A0A8C3Y2S2_CATUS
MLNRPCSLFPRSSQSAAALPPPPSHPDAKHVLSLEPLRSARHRMEGRRRDMELISNSMAAYAHIRGEPGRVREGTAGPGMFLPHPLRSLPAANPESFGLYFVLGVCFGLVLTLCLLVLRLSCRPSPRPPARPGDLSEDDEDDEEDEDEEDTVDRAASESLLPVTEIPLESHSPGDGALAVNVFASAEELERAAGDTEGRLLRGVTSFEGPAVAPRELLASGGAPSVAAGAGGWLPWGSTSME